VSGEFNETNDYARVVSWPLQASGLIDTSAAGRNKQKNELVTGSDLVKFQGVAANGATTVLSASFGSGNPGKRHRIKTQSPYATGGPGMGANSVGAPTGIEDLAGSKASNALWAIAEFPGKRWIWSTSYNANFG
jgi:hypothetical protein